jgi:protein subunit release factor B
MREKLFSVTKKDLEIETFRAGGKGGQNQNKRETGVRIRHRASGAVGESRTERSQDSNKKLAFKRMTEHPKFKLWINQESMRVMGILDDIEDEVDRQMDSKNIKVEVRKDGIWKVE